MRKGSLFRKSQCKTQALESFHRRSEREREDQYFLVCAFARRFCLRERKRSKAQSMPPPSAPSLRFLLVLGSRTVLLQFSSVLCTSRAPSFLSLSLFPFLCLIRSHTLSLSYSFSLSIFFLLCALYNKNNLVPKCILCHEVYLFYFYF